MNINWRLTHVAALISGITVLVMPRLMIPVVAINLIIIGLIGLISAGSFYF